MHESDLTPSEIRDALRENESPSRAGFSLRYFRCQKGEPGYGDRFFGNTVPFCRTLSKQALRCEAWHWESATGPKRIQGLINSKWHEERLIALLILCGLYARADHASVRKQVVDFYLKQAARVDNWDLVDTSAGLILGRWLFETKGQGPHPLLTRMARNRKNKWIRRIAIVSTQWMIRQGSTSEAIRIARILLKDREDLIHKASGWMLREAGARDRTALLRFLSSYAGTMPRTMLRYSIEHFAPSERKIWLLQRDASK